MLTPEQKRVRAIDDPEYLNNLYAHLRKQLPIDAQVLLESSELAIALDEETIVLLTLQEPWVMEPRHQLSVIDLVQSIATEFDIECIGIACGEQCWAAIKTADGWLVTKAFQCEGQSIALPPVTRLHCQGWSCDWKDDCACHAAFRYAHQQGFLNRVKTISPRDPEACPHFTPVVKVNPNI